MERSWSEAAREAIAAYPWKSPRDREKAIAESELVAFGESVELDDLPLAVRQWLRRRSDQSPKYLWCGESWNELVEGFEREILGQALAANGGNYAATARALKTTPRVIAYKARKLKVQSQIDV